MPPNTRIVEKYYDKYRRAIIIEENGEYFYSIDTYTLLPSLPGNAECIDSERTGVKLCYAETTSGCTAVIIAAGSRVELVNVRAVSNREEDPKVVLSRCGEVTSE